MLIDLPIADIIPQTRQRLLITLIPPPSLVFRAVQVESRSNQHVDVVARLQRVELAVDIESERCVGGVCDADDSRHAVVGLVEDGGDLEGVFVERCICGHGCG